MAYCPFSANLLLDPRFTIKTGRSLKICPIDSVAEPPTNAQLL